MFRVSLPQPRCSNPPGSSPNSTMHSPMHAMDGGWSIAENFGRMRIVADSPNSGKMETNKVVPTWPMGVNSEENSRIARNHGSFTKM